MVGEKKRCRARKIRFRAREKRFRAREKVDFEDLHVFVEEDARNDQ
jgi:hypothetical protein